MNLVLETKQTTSSTSGSIGRSSREALADIRVTQTKYIQYALNSTHIITSLLFFVQVALSYLLMLVFMSYNYWLCLSVIVGLGFGYFIFGWSQHDAYVICTIKCMGRFTLSSEGMNGDLLCVSFMTTQFHGGHCERILWSGWVASTETEFGLSCVAWFLIAFLYEALKFARQQLHKHAAQKTAESMAMEVEARHAAHPPGCPHAPPPLTEIRGKSYRDHLFSPHHILQSLLNVVQIIISYLLMLVFMNFNYWLCLSMILGLGFGYFCFGWIRQQGSDTECCT